MGVPWGPAIGGNLPPWYRESSNPREGPWSRGVPGMWGDCGPVVWRDPIPDCGGDPISG